VPLSVLKRIKLCTILQKTRMRVKCGPTMCSPVNTGVYPFAIELQAGLDGALPSVVAGVVEAPVIMKLTSVSS